MKLPHKEYECSECGSKEFDVTSDGLCMGCWYNEEENSQPIDKEISKFSFTQALREMDCPKCQQKAGDDCRQPKGRKQWPPHWERRKAYFDKVGPEEFDRRHTMIATKK